MRSQPGKCAAQAVADEAQISERRRFDQVWLTALLRRGVVRPNDLGPTWRATLAPEIERMADPRASPATIAARVAIKALARKWALGEREASK